MRLLRISGSRTICERNVKIQLCCFLERLFSYSSSLLQKCSKRRETDGPPWKILFFGTDEFSLESLKALCAKLHTGTLINSLGVVTKGCSKVKQFAEKEQLHVYNWPLKSSDTISHYDIGMVVSFGNLIPKAIIESLPLGCVNVHASLLPRWRGASPIIHTIMNGDTDTGVTIMCVHPHRFDVGEIVRQHRISIKWNEAAEELEKKLAKLGAHLLMECVRDLPRCIQHAIPQPSNGITYAPKIKSSMAVVGWQKTNAVGVYNLHRALFHLYPLTTKWYEKTVKLHSVEMDSSSENVLKEPVTEATTFSALTFLNASDTGIEKSPTSSEQKFSGDGGRLDYCKSEKIIRVKCADGRSVIVRKLSVSGKVMSALDFYNGFMTRKNKCEWKFS